jgi:AraC family ethanolamine operon transcriptional activator
MRHESCKNAAMAHPSDTAQPAPPALLSRASFADADEQAAALTGWNQSYLQLSRGAFGGEVRQLEFAGLRLFVEEPAGIGLPDRPDPWRCAGPGAAAAG